MQEDIDTNTTVSINGLNVSIRLHGQQFTSDEEEQAAQALFLAYLAETGVLTRSCKLAHIGFPTYQVWLNNADFADGVKIAQEEFKEKVFAEVDRRGRKGYLEPLVKNGTVILDKKGQPVAVRKYSDRLLELLFNRYYKADNQHSGGLQFTGNEEQGDDIFIHLPWNELDDTEKALVEQIGRNLEARAIQKGVKP